MEVIKRKRETSSVVDNSLQPKKQKSEPLAASTLRETTSLEELLDFSSLNDDSAISNRFDQVGNVLLHDHLLVVRCGDLETEFKILELEFYLQKANCHEDPFTHGSEEQKISGRWYALNFFMFMCCLLANVQVLSPHSTTLRRFSPQHDELDCI